MGSSGVHPVNWHPDMRNSYKHSGFGRSSSVAVHQISAAH